MFDYDNSGTMDFTEYMLAINATNLNTAEDKLMWMFDVFDKDGGGTISVDEIKELLKYLGLNYFLIYWKLIILVVSLRWMDALLMKRILK